VKKNIYFSGLFWYNNLVSNKKLNTTTPALSEAQLAAARKALIAEIAQRHMAERAFIKELERDNEISEIDAAVLEEVEAANKRSTFNPLSR
jgi:hypothetical protein